MPNWCDNLVEIRHTDPAMIKRAHDALERGEFLNEFHPVPPDLKIVAGRVGDDESAEQQALVLQENANRAKYGYTNWYDWCVNKWAPSGMWVAMVVPLLTRMVVLQLRSTVPGLHPSKHIVC